MSTRRSSTCSAGAGCRLAWRCSITSWCSRTCCCRTRRRTRWPASRSSRRRPAR